MVGEPFEWGDHVRIQHLQTYLYVGVSEGQVYLSEDHTDPNTLFKLQPEYDVSLYSKFMESLTLASLKFRF